MTRHGYHLYRAVVHGPAISAGREAQRRGFTVIQIHHSDAHNTILTLEHTDSRVIAQWLGEGPHAPPFPNMTLLFYKEDETGEEHKKVWIAEERGYKLEDDLDGFDMFHPWAVSTLVPGLHDKPKYMYFDEFSEALTYARDRSRKGKRVREGGRAYFILNNTAGGVTHRVIRAKLGAEQRGGQHYTEKREFVLVQRAEGTIPGHPDRTRWSTDKALSVEILDQEIEKARKSMPTRVPAPRERRETLFIQGPQTKKRREE